MATVTKRACELPLSKFRSIRIVASALLYGVVTCSGEVASMAGIGRIQQFAPATRAALVRTGLLKGPIDEALDRVTAAGQPSSAVGEGLADALNVGGL